MQTPWHDMNTMLSVNAELKMIITLATMNALPCTRHHGDYMCNYDLNAQNLFYTLICSLNYIFMSSNNEMNSTQENSKRDEVSDD